MKATINKLSVSSILLGILGGIIGLGAGLFLGFALGAALAAAFHVSTFEGEAGYFAALIAILVTLYRHAKLDCSHALLARCEEHLVVHRVGHGLCLDGSHRCIRIRNLVRGSTARP